MLSYKTLSCVAKLLCKIYHLPKHMKLWSITTLFFFLIFFHLYRTRYNANPCQFVKQGKDWKTEGQSDKKKKKKRMGGDFWIGEKSSLSSFYFSDYKYLVLISFTIQILVHNFIFLIFWSIVWEMRDSHRILTIKKKIIDLGVNGFHLIKKVIVMCFFPLKLLKKGVRILFSVWICVFRWVLVGVRVVLAVYLHWMCFFNFFLLGKIKKICILKKKLKLIIIVINFLVLRE